MVVTRLSVASSERGKAADRDFYADLDKAKRRPSCFSCGGCLGFVVISLLLLALGGASLMAASGIADVPVLSGLLYQSDPSPSRVVEPAEATDFSQLIASKQPTATGGAVEVTEAELTAVLREPTQSGTVTLKRGQVTIDASHAEVYGQVTPGEYGRPVIVRAELSLAGSNQLAVTRLQIGYVEVPVKLATFVATRIAGQDVASTAFLRRYGVTGLALQAGSVSVTIDPMTLMERGAQSLAPQAEQILRNAGINPASLSTDLAPEVLIDIREKIGSLPADEVQRVQSIIPQLKRLDQEEKND